MINKINEIFKKCDIIELSHKLEENIPTPLDLSKYYQNLWTSYNYGDSSLSYQIIMSEHSGTHVDAPAHFMNEDSGVHITIDEIPVTNFLFPCNVIQVNHINNNFISKEIIKNYESINGEIKIGDGVFFNTGWFQKWEVGSVDKKFITSWPGLSIDAVEYLIAKKVTAVGTDCLSIDSSSSLDFPAHNQLLRKQIPIFENLNNLIKVKGRCYIIALPLRIKGGTASPVRVIALQ